MVTKRIFDIFLSFFGILFLLPGFIFIALLVKLTSKGPIIFKQERIGLNGKPFYIFKFRTMHVKRPDKDLQLTIGSRDVRVTRVGYYLRLFKFDEFPQLFNVLFGSMSFVGPRPEVKKYVDLYNDEQRNVLSIRPGITDLASIKYRNESDILSQYSDPEKAYINVLMQDKLKLSLYYVKNSGILLDLKILLMTFGILKFDERI